MTRKHILTLVESLVSDKQTAELVVDTLVTEGVLHIGFGNKEIDLICEQFKQLFGTTKTSKYDRFAASRLAEKYGAQAVTGITKLLADRAAEPYAPVVGSVQQLEDKWVQVLNFVRKSNGEEILDA